MALSGYDVNDGSEVLVGQMDEVECKRWFDNDGQVRPQSSSVLCEGSAK